MTRIKVYIYAILLGLAVGICTVIGQKYLPMNANFLANSGAVWLIPAHLLSFFHKGNKIESILVAIICLLGCVYGYYVFESILNQHAFSLEGDVLLWTAMAFIAGAIFGLGAYFGNQDGSKLQPFGMNMLPAVFTAEGLDNLVNIADYSHMIVAVVLKIVIGVALYVVINRKASVKVMNLVAYAAFTIIGVIGFAILGGAI